MATLTGKLPSQTYKDLLQVSNNNVGVDSTLRAIEDGEGTTSAGRISTNKFQVRPASNGTDTFEVVNSSGSVLFYIDTTNNKVVLNSGVVLEGDGSALTGIVSTGTGGSSATGNLEVQADSDASGSGDIIFKIGTKEVARIPYSYASSLPTGVAGNYFIKTIADNWGNPKGGAKLTSGSSQRYSIPDNDNLDMGTNDFSYFNWFNLADFTPSAEVVLAQKVASNLGWRLSLTTSGALKLSIGNGTNMTTYVYTGSAIGATDGTWNCLGFTADRDGLVTFYSNNVAYGTADISGSSSQTVSNTGDLYWAYDGSTYYTMDINDTYYFNMVASSNARKAIYNNGIVGGAQLPYADKGASQTPTYSSDFSAGADGWSASGGATAGNIDAIDGQDDNLRFTANASLSGHTFFKTSVVTFGKKYRITFDYYIPSTNSNLDGFRVYGGGTTLSNLHNTLDAWTSVTEEYTASETSIQINTLDGGVATYQDLGGDDVMYIRNYKATPIGCVAEYKGDGFGRIGLIDSSGNGLHGTSSGSPIALATEQGLDVVRDVKTLVTGNTTLTSVVPKGYMLKQIIVNNTTANAYTLNVGSATSGGTDVVNASAIGASGFTTITVNKTFSATAAQTLYLQSGAWNSSSSTYYLIMERVAR